MANLTCREKRCEECAYLETKNGKMTCSECFGQLCDEIDECPEGCTLEEWEELDTKAKEIRVDTGAKADKPKRESKPRTVVVSDEKQALFHEIFGKIDEYCQSIGGNAKIEKENKLIIVQIAEKTFKIDLIEQRKPKK